MHAIRATMRAAPLREEAVGGLRAGAREMTDQGAVEERSWKREAVVALRKQLQPPHILNHVALHACKVNQP